MNKKKGAAAVIAAIIALLTVVAGLLAEADAAHAQYGQADLFPYLEEMSYPEELPPAVMEQLQAGVPSGTYGNITLTLDVNADPLDAFGILSQTGEIPDAYLQYDPSYDYATPVGAAAGHTYIIVERTPGMSVDPNLVIGLQSQLSTTVVDLQAQTTQVTQIVIAAIAVTVVGGITALALRGQGILSGLAARMGRGANKDD